MTTIKKYKLYNWLDDDIKKININFFYKINFNTEQIDDKYSYYSISTFIKNKIKKYSGRAPKQEIQNIKNLCEIEHNYNYDTYLNNRQRLIHCIDKDIPIYIIKGENLIKIIYEYNNLLHHYGS